MDLFKLVGQIAVNNAEANEKIDETTTKAQKAARTLSSKASSVGGVVGKKLVGAGKLIGKTFIAGTAAAATGIAALTKTALDSYAQYEQLEGGVKKLFGEASDTVMSFAQDAYKTAGLTANEYMEQVTSFSAAMIKSLGGDTQKAAEMSDLAIRDMADNVNTFGTAAEDVQHAYQGFSKQNFTMLDNLKLGYGGTKAEMQKLLDDANRINAEHGKSTQYQIDNYADIVEAIHVVQEEQGIAGTTAKEASKTIEGSVGAMKSAWGNFLSGLGRDDADVGKLFDDFWNAAVTAGNNILPRVQEILGKIGGVIQEKLPEVMARVPGLLMSVLPSLTQAAVNMVLAIAQAVWDQIPPFMERLPSLIATYIPPLIDAILQALEGLLSRLFGDERSSRIIESLKNLFGTAWELISDFVELVTAFWDAHGQTIMSTVGAVANFMIDTLNGFLEVVDGIIKILKGIVDGDFTLIGEGIKKIISGLFDFAEGIARAKMALISGIIKFALSFVKNLFSSAFEAIKNTVSNWLSVVTSTISNGIETAKQTVTNKFTAIKDTIKNILRGAENIVKGAIDKIKGFFNFKWKLPKLKLPKVTVDGEWSLNPPSAPHFGLEWNDKATKQPFMFSDPTIFGYNPMTGSMKGAGETGDEILYGRQALMNDIDNVVDAKMDKVSQTLRDYFEQLFAIFEQWFPTFEGQLVLDTGALVAETASKMDKELGVIARRRGRQ